jgi:hypothetical protein
MGLENGGHQMNKNTITRLKSSFDAIVQQIPNGVTEFWHARDLELIRK